MELQRELRSQRRRTLDQDRLPARLETAGRILLCRKGGGLESLMQFLVQRSGRPKETLSAWTSKLEAWYLAASVDERAEFSAAAISAAQRRAVSEVDKFLKEQCLHGWVLDRNVRTGIAPASEIVVQQLQSQGLGGSSNRFPDQSRRSKHTYQFLRRWRRRWAVQHGTLSAFSGVSPRELTLKVGRKLGSKWADRRQPVVQARANFRAQKQGHFPAAESRPPMVAE